MIAFIRRNDLKNIVLVGGYDAWLAADLLNENQIAVMLNRVHSLPMREDDDVELPYKMPKILWDKGVLFCLENSGDMENIETRNLGFYAGTAARYGLSQEEALQMITLNAAKVLGVEKELGSLEVGKTATIFLSKGNPLEIKSNGITHVWISGQSVDLTADPQKQLFEKYKKRYGLE